MIAFDTMILIYGLRALNRGAGPKSEKERERRRRARILLTESKQRFRSNQIIVPTIVVAELLTGIPSEAHGTVIANLQENFFCPPFDIRATTIAATVWQARVQAGPPVSGAERRNLKADVLIVATAKLAGARRFYSTDPDCRRVAEIAGLLARDLPSHSEDLFIEAESRREEEEPD